MVTLLFTESNTSQEYKLLLLSPELLSCSCWIGPQATSACLRRAVPPPSSWAAPAPGPSAQPPSSLIRMANGGDAIPGPDPHNQMSIFSIVFTTYLFCLIKSAVQSML